MSRATRRSFAYQQALFTVRRGIYATTLAFTAGSVAAVKYGLDFNMTMEENRVALAHFLGGTGAANRELATLYDLAARTPFEFADLTTAARKFLAFGFTVNETNDYLRILGDTVAGLALGAEGIGRATLAIGQIQAKGRVMGEELLQLTELGIPALQILQRELGLTAEQVGRIGELSIPASVAIPALMRGMAKEFDGAAEEQSKTMRGRLSSLRDYSRQLMGTLTFPLFELLRLRVIPRAAEIVQAMQEAAKDGGGVGAAIRVLDEQVGAGGHIIEWWNRLRSAGSSVRDIFQHALVPAVRTTYGALSILADVGLDPLIALLGFAADHTTLLRIALTIYASWLVITKVRTMAVTIWTWRKVAADKASYFWVWMGVRGLQAQALWLGRVRIQLILAAFFTAAYTKGLILLRTAGIWPVILGLRVLTASMITFLLTNPIGWIILAVGALIALEVKFHVVSDAIKELWGLFRRFKDWITGNKISWDDFLPGKGLFDTAMKLSPIGVPYRIGSAIWDAVDEDEPRRATVPRPRSVQRVDPLRYPQGAPTAGAGAGKQGLPPLKVILDGRELTNSSAKWVEDEEARR